MGAVMVQTGTVMAVNISVKRGEKKHDVGEAYLQEGMGITTDAHRVESPPVNLLSLSSVEKMRQLGLDIQYGDFAENLTVSGLEVYTLPIGTRLKIGEALAEVTQIGKACHNQGCAIKKQAGHCVMPLKAYL